MNEWSVSLMHQHHTPGRSAGRALLRFAAIGACAWSGCRNVPAEDVSREAKARWHALWDGRTLHGWHVIGSGEWKIEDGAIHGTHSSVDQEFGHLVTDSEFTDFAVRLKYKASKGNSGLYFRIEEAGYSGVSGFQAEIDPAHDAGGLYETNGRAWVSQPTPEQVMSWYKPNEWNEMTVSAKGREITVTVNGRTSAELNNDPGRTSGRIALQVHAGQDCDVWFKDIEISAVAR